MTTLADTRPASIKRTTILWWGRLIVSLLTIGFVLTLVKPQAVVQALSHVPIGLWLTVFFVYITGHIVSAFKWRILAAPHAPFISVLRAHFSGLAANIALPGAASGDLVRAGVMLASSSDRAQVAVGSLADRLIDTAGLCLLSVLGILSVGRGVDAVTWAALAGVIVCVPVLVIISRPVLSALLRRLTGQGKVTALLAKLVKAGLILSQNPLKLLICLGLSVVVQACFIVASAQFGIAAGVKLGLAEWFFAWPISKLIATIPTSAGGLGVREASLAGILAQFGGDGARIFASGLVWQSIVITGAVAGSALTWFLSLVFSKPADLAPVHAMPAAILAVETNPMPLSKPSTQSRTPRIAVLGAGPAGIGAAFYLTQQNQASVDVFEASDDVGGAASGLDIEGIHCDLGSHRFHPAADPKILNDVKAVLGEDLLWRPRHGRIRLQGRWIHFPLKPVDFLFNAPLGFIASIGVDTIAKLLPKKKGVTANFATVLEAGLGRTICQSFYFPYAVKLWGVKPEALDAIAAQRRVSGSSIAKLIAKVMNQVPGFKKPHTGGFYYPKKGFRQISDGLKAASERDGARYHLKTRVTQLEPLTEGGLRLTVQTPQGARQEVFDYVWSSIPLTVLASITTVDRPVALDKAISEVRYRSMILIYLVLEQQQFTEYDAHYFPEIEIPLSRLSEPKNYYASQTPQGVTVLCGELPCSTEDNYWSMPDDDLGALMKTWLSAAGLPVHARVRKVLTRRLSHAYPIYDRDFAPKLEAVNDWVSKIPGVVTFGRQGLFAHDNTHHALAMARAAAECINPDGSWNTVAWDLALNAFKDHVVED